jgi:hypothetical protein
MALFVVGADKAGKTLRELRDQYDLPYRPDVMAELVGVDQNTPLTEGQTIRMRDDPGSGEYQSLKKLFTQTTPEQLAQQAQQKAQEQAQKIANEVIESQKKVIEEEKAYAEELFGGKNAFNFDEYNAQESAKQEYSPYYTEMLDDYLTNIGVARDTLESDQKLLGALRSTQSGTMGTENRDYARAVSNAEEGFVGQGMFFSGIKKRALGAAEAEREYGLGNKAIEMQQKNRDVFGTGRQFETAVAQNVETRRGEALKEYYQPKIMAFKRKYPTNTSTLGGYVPEEYLSY